jgi:hypothetical protein
LVGEVWTLLIDALASLSGGSSSENRSSMEWAPSCLVAFRCLKIENESLNPTP